MYFNRRYPDLRTIDQVYDYEIGWINRYDLSIVTYMDAHIGVNSKICKAYIREGAKPDQTYLIENGIDPQELNPADYTEEKVLAVKDKLGLAGNNKTVTFASRLHQQKRPMDFIELTRRFSSDNSLQFLMVGDGPLVDTVDKQIEKTRLNNIHRLPFSRPISDILAVTDVLVLPSDFEGMPMITIETQAMGKPVVVTDVGNNREVLERTNGGVVISRIGDISMLMTGVRKMLADPPDPQQLREDTLAHSDIAIIADKYYDAILGN